MEYRKLLTGLTGDTSLGYVVSIRSETDSDKIKNMTVKEKTIRRDWQEFRRKQQKHTKPVYTMTIEEFQQMMKSLAGR